MAGAVLAGGASRRMGREKAAVEVAGAPMAARVAAAMRAAGATPIAVVGGRGGLARPLGLDHVEDRWPGEGPLAGLATATRWAAAEGALWVLVAACDQPNLRPRLLRDLVAAVDDVVAGAVTVTPDGREHPFPSAWRTSSAPDLERLVEAGARRADAAFALGVASVAADPLEVVDVDRPEDVATAERALAEGGRHGQHRPAP